MRRSLPIVLLCAVLPLAAAAPRDPFDLPVERYKLPSGMTVLLHRDTTLPQVVVSLWFDVGSRKERPGRTGFAHLYEHLMFMGSKHVPVGGFDAIMEEAGGHNNASTSTDTTFYHDSGPAQLLPLLLWLEAERLTTLPAAMTRDKVDLQREVVRNERRQRSENRSYGAAELRIPQAMYPKGHPYSWPVIGSHEDLLAASVSDVKEFFYDHYTPSNATLAIAGDFNAEETRRLIQHYFGWMPKRPLLTTAPPPTPLRPAEAQVTLTDDVDLARLYLVWHAPKAGTKEAAQAMLLADVLGLGQGSRLHRALVYDKRLAQEVKVEVEEQALGSLLVAEITAQSGVRPEDLLRATEAELARVVREPIKAEELERARNLRLTAWAQELETLVDRSYVLQKMQKLHGDPGALKQEVAQLRELQPDALRAQAAALGLADAGRRLTLRVLPRGGKGGAAQGNKSEPPATAKAKEGAKEAEGPTGRDMVAPYDLSRRPTAQSPRPFVPPKAARFRVGQLDVVLVQRKGALLEALLMVPAGAGDSPPARPGLAQAVAALVTEGAGERSATEVAEALERRGAHLEREVTQDSTLFALSLTSTEWPRVAPILYDIAARPRLDEKEWPRVRGERIAEVLREGAEARYVADLAVFSGIFGPAHAYGLPPLGTAAGLRALELSELRAFHGRHYRPSLVSLVLVGDVELSQAEAARLAAPFAAWQDGPAGAREKEAFPAPRPERPRLVLIDRPGAPQSELRVANLAPAQGSKERPAAEVANMLLGGSFTSRLNQNLRERRGWAYGAGSRLLPLSQAGLFVARAAVRSDVTAESAAEVLGELGRLLSAPLSPQELEKGRRSVAQQVLHLCERVADLGLLYGEVARHRLPLDTPAQLLRGAKRADGAAVMAAARSAIRPKSATVVIVGDRKKVEAKLREKLPGFEIEIGVPRP